MGGTNTPLLPGYRVKFLDGNCIEATEHRLKVLRETAAGPLPGKSLVVFDSELGIAIDVFPCEDGHAQEQTLVPAVLDTVRAKDVWVADRNFCVLDTMFAVHDKSAFFIFRQHARTPIKSLSSLVFIGETETGKVFEQRVEIAATTQDDTLQIRRIVVELNKPTRDGETEIAVLTNLPESVDAILVSNIYRSRWGIETAFQKLEKHLNSEINTLGYPKAALFGFCLALVAFNIYAIVMAALRATHPDQQINKIVSEHYIAQEIENNTGGMLIAVPQAEWSIFATASLLELAALILNIASHVDLKKYRKHPRGPKKPPRAKTKFEGHRHVSTAKLLKEEAERKARRGR
jgi:hypothetical protein